MNLSVAIVLRELIATPRSRRFYLKRASVIFIGGLIIVWGVTMSGRGASTTVGLQIFMWTAIATLAAACLLSAMNASWLIMREKEERTLGLLLISDVSSWSFLFGKLMTSLFSMTMTVLSMLPLFMLAVSLGGVSAVQILAAYGVLLTTIFLVGCVGIFVATVSRREATMNFGLGVSGFVLYLVLPIALGILTGYTPTRAAAQWLQPIVSPFVAMWLLVEGRRMDAALLNCAFNAALGLPLLLAARSALAWSVLSRDRATAGERMAWSVRGSRRLRQWVRPPLPYGNPVTWKDLHFYHGGVRAIWLKFGVATGSVLFIWIGCLVLIGDLKVGEMINATTVMLFFYSALVFFLGSISHCGMAFNREKRARTFEVLLTTKLEQEEIIGGKLRAMFISLLPWLLLMLLTGLRVMALAIEDDLPADVGIGLVLEYVSMWFGYSALALWMSLRFRKNVSFALCVFIFLLWNMLGRTILITLMMPIMWDFGGVVALDVIAHLILGSICIAKVFGSFRKYALASAE